MRVLPDEVFICDDGSTEETAHMVTGFSKTFPVPLEHLWQPDEGWRLTKARNMGIRKSSGDYIIFIDGDCIPGHRFIEDHKFLAEKGAMVFGDRIHVIESAVDSFSPDLFSLLLYSAKRKLRKRSIVLRSPWEKPTIFGLEDVDAHSLANIALGCNMGFWKKDMERVNGFDEKMTGWALEDIEVTARMLVSGIKIKKIRKKAIVYHLDHGVEDYDKETILDRIENALMSTSYWTDFGLKS